MVPCPLLGTYHTYLITHPSLLRDILADFHSLWGDRQFADATIVMGDQTWKVHRWVICKQSSYFMTALEGSFMVRRLATHTTCFYHRSFNTLTLTPPPPPRLHVKLTKLKKMTGGPR